MTHALISCYQLMAQLVALLLLLGLPSTTLSSPECSGDGLVIDVEPLEEEELLLPQEGLQQQQQQQQQLVEPYLGSGKMFDTISDYYDTVNTYFTFNLSNIC